jgi:hypothetical protein
MENPIEFPGGSNQPQSAQRGEASQSRYYRNRRPNIRTLAFRSYDQILKVDEAELIESVCLDIEGRARYWSGPCKKRPSGTDDRATAPPRHRQRLALEA